jgi:hypothetical protein
VLKSNAWEFLYGIEYTVHIWIKSKQVSFFNFIVYLSTGISPHKYLCVLHTFTPLKVLS